MTILPSAYCGNLFSLGLFMSGYFMSKIEVGDSVIPIEGLTVPLYVQFINGDAVTCAFIKDKVPCTVTLNANFLKKIEKPANS
ncbi:hypothetical protein [Aeromonas dhakensis]|uniref:hypothetical protein n=1 Tax=Aeromonas dhakensis TaxID=196024 RepID=UPI0038CF6258